MSEPLEYIALADRKPDLGQHVIASDGQARWLDRYDGGEMGFCGLGPKRIATHWFAVPYELPKRASVTA